MRQFFWKMATVLAVCLGLGACASGGPAAVEPAQANLEAPALEDYRLGPSDKVRLIVFGEDDISGEYALSATGHIAVPLLGEVDARGKTVNELSEAIAAGLSEGYVNDAKVAAEVVAFRPYYILGEVVRPGEYPYSAGMTVMKAVAAAEGYTYRAKKNSVFIKRATADEETNVKLSKDIPIYPGDVVRVGERFF